MNHIFGLLEKKSECVTVSTSIMSVTVANNLAAPSEGRERRPASYYSATFVQSKCELLQQAARAAVFLCRPLAS